MTLERAKELQQSITQQALVLIAIGGKEAEVDNHVRTIELIGKAWEIEPEQAGEMTEHIRRAQAEGLTEDEETDLNLIANWSGLMILDAQEDLFKTAIRLDDISDRTTLFNMAQEIGETENLLDWIEKTPAEKQAWMAPTN